MTDRLTLGSLLKQSREQLGWTQSRVGASVGVTDGFIAKLENDESLPSADRLNALARVLALDADMLLNLLAEQRHQRFQERMRARGSVSRSVYTSQPAGASSDASGMKGVPTAEQIGKQILDDPDLNKAFNWLRAIIAHGDLRPVVLTVLESLSRSADPKERNE